MGKVNILKQIIKEEIKNSLTKISVSNNFLNINDFNHFIHGLKIKSYESYILCVESYTLRLEP